MNFTAINQDFIDWAKSFSGMNGGNLKAPLWFCGIEFGGGDPIDFKINERYCYKNTEGKFVPCWNDKFKQDKKDYKKWQYGQKVAKISCQYKTGQIGYEIYQDYMDRLFTKDGDTFAMNLYPLSFTESSDDAWDEIHYKETGFSNKIMYKAWCMAYRFPFLRELVYGNKPKVLICTGNNFWKDFRLAFAPQEMLFENSSENSFYKYRKIDKYDCEWFEHKGTVVILTPFLGQGGIMSDNGLKALAEFAKKLT